MRAAKSPCHDSRGQPACAWFAVTFAAKGNYGSPRPAHSLSMFLATLPRSLWIRGGFHALGFPWRSTRKWVLSGTRTNTRPPGRTVWHGSALSVLDIGRLIGVL